MDAGTPTPIFPARRWVGLALAGSLGLLLILAGLAYRSLSGLVHAGERRKQTYETVILLERAFSLVKDAETGQRGYFLTGDSAYLAPYQKAVQELPGALEVLRAGATRDPELSRYFDRIEALLRARQAELDATVRLFDRKGPEAALQVVRTNAGKRAMDELRQRMDAATRAELQAAELRDLALADASASVQVLLLLGALGAVLAVGISAVALARENGQRLQTQEALQETEERLQAFVEHAPAAVYMKDADGRFVMVNREVTRVIGLPVEQILGHTVGEMFPDSYAADYTHNDATVLRAGQACEFEERAPAPEGGTRTFLSVKFPVRDPAGRVSAVGGISTDITDRKAAEAALREARDLADAASRAKSEFLANMSHELRTPLNAILGFSELLQDEIFGELNERQKEYVDSVLSNGKHLLTLINDILDLAKVESGRMNLEEGPVDMATVFTGVVTLVRPLAQRKQIDLSSAPVPNLPPILADGAKLKQVMYNLLSNAIKYTPDGGRVTVKVELPPATSAGPLLRVSVIDTGIGLSEGDRERIFGTFEQVDSSYARQQQGTGLGLALTRRLVELHGGRIWAESEGEGRGSRFIFEIPLRIHLDWVEPPGELEPLDAAVEPPAPGDGRPLVLVVEDDPEARELLAHYLRQANYRVAAVADAAQALVLARGIRPDVITLDILMPGTDGFSALAELKARRETRDIPVIIVSITDDRDIAVNMGASDWLVKPVDRHRLAVSIRRALAVASGDGWKVLVVDDEPDTRRLLYDMLEAEGFHVLLASGGQAGLDLARTEHPDVIVLDLMMPGVTGFDVIRRLREWEETSRVPVIVYTAKDLSAADREVLRAEVGAVVRKNGAEELLIELARASRRPRVRPEGTAE